VGGGEEGGGCKVCGRGGQGWGGGGRRGVGIEGRWQELSQKTTGRTQESGGRKRDGAFFDEKVPQKRKKN